MTWARFDDRYDDNPKVRRAWRAHPRAVGMHAMAVTYCARNETDGHVEAGWLEEKLPAKRERDAVLGALSDAGLFVADPDGGFWVHDFLDFNPSREEVRVKRADTHDAKSKAGKKGAEAKWRRERISQSMRQTVARRLGVAIGGLAASACEYCGAEIIVDWTNPKRVSFRDIEGRSTPELDHVDSLINGGAHDASNLRLACLSCNRKKGTASGTALADASDLSSNGSSTEGVEW